VTPGSKLGRYTLIRRLGVGGMGEVYLAKAEGAANFTKQVAIKRILPHLARNEESVAKFIDEAQIMVQLHHGNIVPVIELADEDGELFLVTEYVPGRDLKSVLRAMRKRSISMPPDLALLLIRQVCAGLDYAHRKIGADGIPLGIVHRDISPSNIVLGAGGEVKLIDFGIARGRGLLHQSVSGTLQGKFIYMSPEQADGRTLDSRSDLFSTGLVLYELLSGVRPFEGKSETETLRHVRQGEVSEVIQHRPDLPISLNNLAMRALKKDVDARYQTADEFGRSISHYLALNESSANAEQISQFLEVLFPEGVVPRGEDRPQSLDEALNMQLNALTPNPGQMELTRTNTGPIPVDAPRVRSHSASTPTTDAVNPLTVTTDQPVSHITVVEPAKGRKRMLFLGLSLGVIASWAAVFWAESPLGGTLSVTVIPESIQDSKITVDDVPLRPNERLRAGRVYRICVSADGFQTHCERRELSVGENQTQVTLHPLPTLAPIVIPDGVNPQISVDGADVTQLPMRVDAGKTYTVCAKADGFVSAPECERIKAVSGVYRPQFTFTAVVAPSEVLAKAKSAPTVKEAQPAKNRPQPKLRTRVKLKSIPIAEVWSQGASIGTTPHVITIGQRSQKYTLRAKGYAPTKVIVRPGQRGDLSVPLKRHAYLTLRVHPPASEIWLDGERIAEGLLNRHPAQPGRHDLEVKYYRDGELVGRVKQEVELTAGKMHRLPTINVKPSPVKHGAED
jgi:serine/threonine protein kinase